VSPPHAEAVVVGAAVLLVLLAVLIWLLREPGSARLEGWWHHQQPGTGQRWRPEAWASACDGSLERSRERRGAACKISCKSALDLDTEAKTCYISGYAVHHHHPRSQRADHHEHPQP
jgi:hypothetical protein